MEFFITPVILKINSRKFMRVKFSSVTFLSWLLCACGQSAVHTQNGLNPVSSPQAEENIVADIPTPEGYKPFAAEAGSFADYLRNIRLKKDRTVYLYNGQIKPNQAVQYAVLDISVGTKDLQQCADAVIRLRAEYLFHKKCFNTIRFNAGDGTALSFEEWLKGQRYKLSGNKLSSYRIASGGNTRKQFEEYLQFVFTYCGTATLGSSLKSRPVHQMQIGDVFLKSGSPGHAVIVMDMAQNIQGQKIYLLAQSYMLAQNIHILKNALNQTLNPWYELTGNETISTPEWTFYKNQLYSWHFNPCPIHSKEIKKT